MTCFWTDLELTSQLCTGGVDPGGGELRPSQQGYTASAYRHFVIREDFTDVPDYSYEDRFSETGASVFAVLIGSRLLLSAYDLWGLDSNIYSIGLLSADLYAVPRSASFVEIYDPFEDAAFVQSLLVSGTPVGYASTNPFTGDPMLGSLRVRFEADGAISGLPALDSGLIYLIRLTADIYSNGEFFDGPFDIECPIALEVPQETVDVGAVGEYPSSVAYLVGATRVRAFIGSDSIRNAVGYIYSNSEQPCENIDPLIEGVPVSFSNSCS